uniref:M20/M25/M40 family metallo-hydrolase n=1 Tax=Nonomuraea rhizosphaerae TaxID=2665663 RepID=UPI001C606BDF
GTYDMKGGLPAALIAAREASRAGLPGEVVVAAVADEEHSSIGVQEVLRHLAASGGTSAGLTTGAATGIDAAIVAEPTELAVTVAHRGFVWIEIEVVGLAAHGSRPHLGRDAILKTGPVLVALASLNEQLRAREHPLLGHGFVHGSLIHGGREESTIPDRCVLTVERRTLPGETTEDVEREIAGLLASCRAADPELEAVARTTLARPPFEVPRDAAIVGAVASAAGQALGRPATIEGVSYWADSSLIAAAGIPTVLFGPAGEGAHAAVEWVSLQSVVTCADTFTAVARQFCG